MTVLTLASSAPGQPQPGPKAKERPLSKQRLVRLVRNSKDDPQFRQLQLKSFVKQHLRRSAGVPEEEALQILKKITAPFVNGKGTDRDQEILADTGDLLFHFEEAPQLESGLGKEAQEFAEALKKAVTPNASEWHGHQMNFEWLITNFSKQQETMYSPIHVLDGLPWRLRVDPKGDNDPNHLSAFVMVATKDPKARQRVEYSITIVNQRDPSRKDVGGPSEQTFVGATSWGYRAFIPLKRLAKKSEGWIVDDTLKIVASVKRLVG